MLYLIIDFRTILEHAVTLLVMHLVFVYVIWLFSMYIVFF